MEYQKIIIFLDNTPNQLSRFRTKNWIEINDQSRGVYNNSSDIRFKTTMLKSSLCDYSDVNILFKETIAITGAGDDATPRQEDEKNKCLIFKNCALSINCKSKINNTEINNADDIDIVMQMYNLIEYNDNYSKTCGNLWRYYKDEPNHNLTDSESFKSKVIITRSTPNNGIIKDAEIIAPLKCLDNFWKTLEMPLINCEVSLILICSSVCVLTNSTAAGRFAITDTILYVPVVTLSKQDNGRTSNSNYYLPKETIKDYSVMIDGKNVFDQPINNEFKT